VFRPDRPNSTSFRAGHAKHADFCDVFKNNTKPLYLLAFLLTANHKEAEQCLVATVEESFTEQVVFKEWVRFWIKRKLIKNAIEIVLPASARNGWKRDLWGARQRERQTEPEIDAVTKLHAFERFVFVLSILERYSNWDCSLLLGRSVNEVAQARLKALRRLPDLGALLPLGDELPMGRQQMRA
jgi:hypothetical protein